MPCYHPLNAIKTDQQKTVNGKDKIIFIKDKTKYMQLPDDIKIQIPCGQCIGCRLEYSRQWANRCIIEAKQWEHNYFITLTYATQHLPIQTTLNTDTGELTETETLNPKHLKKFLKDVRRYYKYHYNHDNIRFFACGEYGEKNGRPHYHILMYNLPITDLIPYAKNHIGQQRWQSAQIEKIWGKGIIDIGTVTWESAAYTARYIIKKQTGAAAAEAYKTKQAEFTRMSRMPGIAKDYYDTNKYKIYENDEMIINKADGSARKIKPTKYYDRLFDIDEPEIMEQIKKTRKMIAETQMDMELKKTDKTAEEYLQTKKENKIAQIQHLKRGIEE